MHSFTSQNLNSNPPFKSSNSSTNPLWLRCGRDGSFVVTALRFGKWIKPLTGIYREVILFWDAVIEFCVLLEGLSLPWSFRFRALRWLVMSVRGDGCMIRGIYSFCILWVPYMHKRPKLHQYFWVCVCLWNSPLDQDEKENITSVFLDNIDHTFFFLHQFYNTPTNKLNTYLQYQ